MDDIEAFKLVSIKKKLVAQQVEIIMWPFSFTFWGLSHTNILLSGIERSVARSSNIAAASIGLRAITLQKRVVYIKACNLIHKSNHCTMEVGIIQILSHFFRS